MRIVLTLASLVLTALSMAQHPARYSRVRITCDEAHSRQELSALGLAIDHALHESDGVTAELSQEEIAVARANGFPVEVLIEDVTSFYRERSAESHGARGGGAACNPASAYPMPQSFALGSMGGYLTWEEMLANLDAMRAAYPQLITEKQEIGLTIEGRPLHLVRLSNNADVDQDKPEVLYTALHHSREPVSLSQLIYFLWHLLEGYGTDAEATYVLDHFELYAVPCINPDGYVYNATNDPAGGGMWRKNRRDNGDGSFGVDLNRNYAQGWGVDDLGSSPNPASDVYRGSAPFSEPETQALRDLCNAHAFRLALNYHAYGNLFIYPWGYDFDIYTPDSAWFVQAGLQATHDNRYRFGTANQTVNYVVNGGSDDWMYGEQVSKPKIMSCTPECGGPDDWFWPPEWRITEICAENLRQNLRAAELTGVFGQARDAAAAILPPFDAHAAFRLWRLGLEPGPITVAVEPLMNIESVGAPITFPALALLEERLDSIPITLSAGVQQGDPVEYVLAASNGVFTWRDTVRKAMGTEVVLFTDDCSALANWSTSGWGTTDERFASAPACFADSPFGTYAPFAVSELTLAQPIDLGFAAAPRLQFNAAWDIESRNDLAQVLGSSNGLQWSPLCGRIARPGYDNQGLGDPVLDAQSPDWRREEIDLSDYAGGPFWLRFQLLSNDSREYDGIYIDDVRVLGSFMIGGVADANAGSTISVFPVPTSDHLRLHVAGSANALVVELRDAMGALVKRVAVQRGSNDLPIEDLAAGTYACSLIGAEGLLATERIVVVR